MIRLGIKKTAIWYSAVSSNKIDKYKYLNGEEILSSNRQQIIEQAQFTYSPFEKLLKNKQKQLKIKEKNKLSL